LTISKNIFNSKSISVPQYVVLKWNLDKEGSVYVMLEEPGNLFYFYQLRHPDGPHYKISINHYSVEVCENLKICQKLVDCEKAIVTNMINGTNNSSIVFLSWKLFESDLFMIVGQYKDTFFKCKNHKPGFAITKLVMASTKHQSFKIIDGSFRITTEELPAKSIKNFDLPKYSYVSLLIFQCYYCNVNVKLTCDNSLVDKEVVFGRNGTQMIFSNNVLVYGWTKIDLFKRIQEQNNCSLLIEPKQAESVDEKHVNAIWTIAQCVIRYLEEPEISMKISTTTSTASSTITDVGISANTTIFCDENQFIGHDSHKKLNCIEDKVQTYYGQWFFLVTTIMQFLILCIVVFLLFKLTLNESNRKKPASNQESRNPEEIPLSETI
jgi:large-conductance mechanosensitive channel